MCRCKFGGAASLSDRYTDRIFTTTIGFTCVHSNFQYTGDTYNVEPHVVLTDLKFEGDKETDFIMEGMCAVSIIYYICFINNYIRFIYKNV